MCKWHKKIQCLNWHPKVALCGSVALCAKVAENCENDEWGHQVWRASRPRGEMLVGEVVKRIEDWRKLASYAIDSLIERDMSVHFGNWRYFGPEVAKVGLDIESTVWDAVLEEVVVDLIVSTSKRY